MSDLYAGKIVVGLIATVLLLAFSSCQVFTSDTWTVHVYPNKSDLSASRKIGEYSSLGECRDAAVSVIEANRWTNAEYECGLNCKPMFPDMPDSVLVCEQTLH